MLKRIAKGAVRRAKRLVQFEQSTTAVIADDLRARLRAETIGTIFDVGAHRGESVKEFSRLYPAAKIHAFEPDPTSFAVLSRLYRDKAAVFNLGLSSTPGTVRFDTRDANTTMHKFANNQSDEGLPSVEVTTIDLFCASNNIASIDFLKIDTEGHDLEVLKGGVATLSKHAVNIVETECGTSRDNAHHVSLFEVHPFMEAHGYRLLQFYEQVHEWPTGRPNLRRVNAVYISPHVIERNRDAP